MLAGREQYELRPFFYTPLREVEAVRYRPIDNSFSFITNAASNDAFYSDSQFIGFGFGQQTTTTEIRVLQVYDASPALEATPLSFGTVCALGQRYHPAVIAQAARGARRKRALTVGSIVFLTLRSETKDILDVAYVADTVIKERVQTIPGVASVRIFGDKRYAMRLMLDAERMAADSTREPHNLPLLLKAAVASEEAGAPEHVFGHAVEQRRQRALHAQEHQSAQYEPDRRERHRQRPRAMVRSTRTACRA